MYNNINKMYIDDNVLVLRILLHDFDTCKTDTTEDIQCKLNLLLCTYPLLRKLRRFPNEFMVVSSNYSDTVNFAALAMTLLEKVKDHMNPDVYIRFSIVIVTNKVCSTLTLHGTNEILKLDSCYIGSVVNLLLPISVAYGSSPSSSSNSSVIGGNTCEHQDNGCNDMTEDSSSNGCDSGSIGLRMIAMSPLIDDTNTVIIIDDVFNVIKHDYDFQYVGNITITATAVSNTHDSQDIGMYKINKDAWSSRCGSSSSSSSDDNSMYIADVSVAESSDKHTFLPSRMMLDPVILIVDDSIMTRKVIINKMKISFPYSNILEACNGEECLYIIDRLKTDSLLPSELIVLLDMHMPVMNGFETITKLRQIEANSNHRTQVVSITIEDLAAVQPTIISHFNSSMQKPFLIQNFLELFTHPS